MIEIGRRLDAGRDRWELPAPARAIEERWQRPLDAAILIASALTVPAVALHFGHLVPALATALSWLVWSVFVVEVVIMVGVSAHPGCWLRSHRLELCVLVVAFPLLPALSPDLYAFELVPSLELSHLVGAAKVLKALRVLARRAGAES